MKMTTKTPGRAELPEATRDLHNTRTRLVGHRTGLLAETIVAVVRFSRGVRALTGGAVRRVASVVTHFGWFLLIAAPVSLGFGYRFGWLELVVVGWIGLVLLVIAVLYLIGGRAHDIELSLVHQRVVVGEPAHGRVRASNPTRRRLLGVTVEVPVGTGLTEFSLPSLPRGGHHDHEFVVPTPRRGVLTIGPGRTVRADPIGLVRREVVLTGTSELFIHPRTISVPSTTTGFVRDLEGNPTRQLSNSDVSFHALREYSTGDERRFIHWRSTAKAGTYMVRQFEETRRSHLVVALSIAAADYANETEFELAVSVAGSLGVRAIRDARNVSVVVGERTPEFAKRAVFAVSPLDTVTPPRLLDDLARVELAESALAVRDVARVVVDGIPGVSVAFLICGSRPSPGQLRSASAAFPADVDVVAIVCDPETMPGLRRVPGLHVLTIGYLADLKAALSRSAAA